MLSLHRIIFVYNDKYIIINNINSNLTHQLLLVALIQQCVFTGLFLFLLSLTK